MHTLCARFSALQKNPAFIYAAICGPEIGSGGTIVGTGREIPRTDHLAIARSAAAFFGTCKAIELLAKNIAHGRECTQYDDTHLQQAIHFIATCSDEWLEGNSEEAQVLQGACMFLHATWATSLILVGICKHDEDPMKRLEDGDLKAWRELDTPTKKKDALRLRRNAHAIAVKLALIASPT